MKHLADRRAVLLAAGTAALAAVAGTVSAQSSAVRGTVEFEGGKLIPEGRLAIQLSDPALKNDAQTPAAATRLDSDGKSRALDFSLPLPASWAASESAQIVARLERADGWLLARGSAKAEADAAIHITLYTVMY